MTTKPMTLRKFMERLPRDGWSLVSKGDGRHWIRQCDRRPYSCCPLTAAFNPLKATAWGAELAMEHGMSERTAGAIMNAADDWPHMSPTERRIRRLLLKHCNLTEPQQ
jgi:hypothetical protein